LNLAICNPAILQFTVRDGPDFALSIDMTPAELRDRCEMFAGSILKFTNPLISRLATRDMSLQLRRSGTSVAQSYAAASIAKSHRDFISKMRGALEEADETSRWLRMLDNASLIEGGVPAELLSEARQLTAIFAASCATAERRERTKGR